MYSNSLIYGKNKLERIVSIEISEDVATVFRELEDGSLDIQKHPNRFWILASKQYGAGWIKLEGEQTFKYGKQYKDYKDWAKDKKALPYKDIYCISNQKEAMMVKDGMTYYKGMKYNEPSILSFDIESTGLEHTDDSKVILISNTFRRRGVITRKLFCHDDYKNCAEMIQAWAAWVVEMDPSIICGHNIYSFDFPYLIYCNSKYSDEPISLGRMGKPIYVNQYTSEYRVDGSRAISYNKVQIYGREIVDTLFLSYKYDAVEKKYESYSLKPIIAMEKLEKPGRVFYDASTIRINYKIPSEMVKIKSYAEDDADDAISLYDLMSPAQFYLTQSIPKPFQLVVESATGSQINSLLVRAYLQDKHSVAKADDLTEEKVEGGISLAVPGIYKNIYKIDIKSCYPSQILRFKLYEERKDPKAYYYYLVEHFTLQRFEYKKQMLATGDLYYKNLDAMAKIFINSSYGVANTSGLNYNSANVARKITMESRAIIDMALRWASGTGYNNWATKFYDATGEKEADRVYLSLPEESLPTKYQHDFIIGPSDTDSISFCKQDMSEFSPEEIKTLLGEINEQSPDKVLWEDDGLYKTIVALKAKNYVLYDGKKLKIKGSALKATTKSPAMKEFIRKTIDTMVYTENIEEVNPKLKEIYDGYVKEAVSVGDMKRWATRKTLSETMAKSTRKNETAPMDAIKGSDYRMGDRFHIYRMPDDTYKLVEHYDGVYCKETLLSHIWDTVAVFGFVLPVKTMFTNWTLKKNLKILLDKHSS
jgi:DNA polymerase I